MTTFQTKFLDYTVLPRAGWVIAAACVGSLLFAFILQLGFGVEPCVLCIWQRWPYAVSGVLATLVAAAKLEGQGQRAVTVLIILSFLSGMGLAIFHTGVEQHWWMGTSGCTIKPLHSSTVDDLREELLSTLSGRCDQISWTLLGLSLTNWNIALSAILAGLTGFVYRRSA